MNKTNEKRNKNRGIIHGDENKNDGYNGNDERNINLDCPASNLGNRDVHNKVDGTADILGERNQKDRYKNN